MATKSQPIDRLFILKNDSPPLQFILRNRHKKNSPLLFFDKENNRQRALRYATNHSSPFEDEQDGEVVLGSIVFKNGKLLVSSSEPTLQEFLMIHPLRDKVFELFEPEKQAEKELTALELEAEAIAKVFDMEADEIESVALAIPSIGSRALTEKTSVIKRDVMVYAKTEPKAFLSLLADDLTKLRGLGIRAVDNNLLTIKNEAFYNNDDLICKIPFDETDPYRTLARYMKTKEGQKLQEFLNSKLK